MKCDYPECPHPAAFECECQGEGISETRNVCAEHKDRAKAICVLFDWTLIVKPIATEVN